MIPLPKYELRVYRDCDRVPAEAEELFAHQLADVRRRLGERRRDRDLNDFILTCAVSDGGHVLGGVQLDIAPLGGAGPLASFRIAYLERTLVRPEYRRRGLATELLRSALRVVADEHCLYVRCSNNWDNEAERRLFLKCGFALVDLDGEADAEPSYLAIRPLEAGDR